MPVSRLGLGLAGLGRPAYMTLGRQDDLGDDRTMESMWARCRALLDAAYGARIRYIDAARSYGLAEHFLRRWCNDRQVAPRALTIGSKWGYTYLGGWRLDSPVHEVKRLTLETLQRQADESRAILGSRLALYQIHSATEESGVLTDRAVLTELARLRSQGLAIGLTVTGPRQTEAIRRAIAIHADGLTLFSAVQATWNLLERSAGQALADASAAGLGVIVKEVLANGRLTSRYATADLRDVQAQAAAAGMTIETFAVAAALQQPWATVVLSGAVTCDQLRAAVAALAAEIGDQLPPVAEPPSTYWRRRADIAWS